MGKKPRETELKEEGAVILDRLKSAPAAVVVDMDERQRLLDSFGDSEQNIDILLSLKEGEQDE